MTDDVTVAGLLAAAASIALVLFLVLGVPVVLYRDMKARRRMAWSYVFLYLVLPPVGLLAWYIDRRRFPLALTSSGGHQVPR